MSQFTPVLSAIKEAEDHSLKTRLAEYLLRIVSNTKLTAEDGQVLSDFVFEELGRLLKKIPAASDYKTKDAMMSYEDQLIGLVMKVFPKPTDVPRDMINLINEIVALVEKERFFENAVDKLFREETIYTGYVERLINQHKQLTDEYQKGQLYAGMLHYQNVIPKIPDDGRALLADHLASEIQHYLKGELTPEVLNNLELISDVAKYIPTDAVMEQLDKVLALGYSHINVYALASLLAAGKEVSQGVVDALARDLSFACLAYDALKRHGKDGMFPAELANEEYLAKSDLVRWLTYPTELGKEPDAIEYLGKTKVKKETFHIFRYKSDSDNLDEERKNQWLIGWSSDDGGTFSQFDLYAPFEKKTPEKTVKYIRKKLL